MSQEPLEAELLTEAPDAVSDESAANGTVRLVPQAEQLRNPDAAITLASTTGTDLLQRFGPGLQGIASSDNAHFRRSFWELAQVDAGWVRLQATPDQTFPFRGRDEVLYWEDGHGKLTDVCQEGASFRGQSGWGRNGIAVNRVGRLFVTLYTGEIFDDATSVMPVVAANALPAIWCFCSDAGYERAVRKLNQKLSVANSTLVKVPFDLAHWQKVAAEKYPNGLPEPQSDDPTQWLFHGHPAGRVPLTTDPNPHLASVLQVAVARVVGYRWPSELDAKMRLAPEARAWVEKCKDLEKFADDDGVVPLVPINKEQPGAERVRTLLEAAFGSKWTLGLLNDLLAAAGSPGKSLDEWLKHEFWAQHCALFHQRPFVWQIWDGKKDGFNVLVHYHRLAGSNGKGKKLLEKVTYTYLGDWITQQQAAAKRGEPGADTRLKAAQDLQKKLEAIIAGEPPYDIFVRWKPLHEQPIGWDPDINDGVRVNIRPFVTAGVLRGKVNVKWTKDRGKEPESIRPKAQFPWFYGCPEDEPPIDFTGSAKFTGERLNNLHYTGKAKQMAREHAGGDS